MLQSRRWDAKERPGWNGRYGIGDCIFLTHPDPVWALAEAVELIANVATLTLGGNFPVLLRGALAFGEVQHLASVFMPERRDAVNLDGPAVVEAVRLVEGPRPDGNKPKGPRVWIAPSCESEIRTDAPRLADWLLTGQDNEPTEALWLLPTSPERFSSEEELERFERGEDLLAREIRVAERARLHAVAVHESVAVQPAPLERFLMERGARMRRGQRDLDRVGIDLAREPDGGRDGLARLAGQTQDERAVDLDAEALGVLRELAGEVDAHALLDVIEDLLLPGLVADQQQAQPVVLQNLTGLVNIKRPGAIARRGVLIWPPATGDGCPSTLQPELSLLSAILW